MKINISQHIPRKLEGTTIISKVSILTRIRKITLEYLSEIYLNSDVIHVMRKDTSPNIFLEIKVALTRRRKTI